MAAVNGDNQEAASNLSYLQSLMGIGQQGTQVNQTNPYGSETWTTDANGNRVLTTNYSPDVTADQSGQLAARNTARGVYTGAAGNLAATEANGGYNTANVNAPGIQYGTTPSSQMTGYSRSTFQAIPGATDFQGNQQQVQDALYGSSTAILDPQYAQAQDQLDSKLRNQGFTAGDEGYDAAEGNFDRSKQADYANARNTAIAGGQQVASNLLADALRIRGTQDTESQQDLTNYNTAADDNYTQRAQQVAANNAGRTQAVNEYASDFAVPLQQYTATANSLPSGSALPTFGSPTTALAQPSSPSFLDMSQFTAGNQQKNDTRNTQIISSLLSGLTGAGSAGAGSNTNGAVGQFLSWLNSGGSSALPQTAINAAGAIPGLTQDISDYTGVGGFFGF